MALLASTILAGTNFAYVTNVHAQTAVDKCLTAPKGATPEGSHWYYRLERGTKRQCWYLRDENDKVARAAPQDSSAEAAADSASTDPTPPPRPAVRKPLANARAELTVPQQRVEREPVAVPEPRTVGMAPAAPVSQSSPAVNQPNAPTPSSTVATRWLDSTSMSSSNSFRSAAAEPPAAPMEIKQATPALATVALAAADSSMAKQTASLQMLFLVMAGALALAGITASLLFRLGRARARRSEIRRDRRAIWDNVHRERASPPMLYGDDVPSRRRDEFHDTHSPHAPDDPQRRVTEMLSRLARSAQN